jgi:hypothetical protein
MKDRKVLWDKPIGEMFLFNNEDEVKLFFCKLALDPETMEDLGVGIDHNDEEWFVDSGEVFVAPIFDTNPYMGYSREKYAALDDEWHYKPTDFKLNPEIYRNYPIVAYLLIEDSFDRFGDVKNKIVNIQPLSEITTVGKALDTEKEYHEIWKKNLEDALEWEALRDETFGGDVY